MSVCPHHWTVTSECPKCLRVQLDAERTFRFELRKWVTAKHDKLEEANPKDRAVSMAFEVLCKIAELERKIDD